MGFDPNSSPTGCWAGRLSRQMDRSADGGEAGEGLAAAQGPHTVDSLPTWVGANRSQPQPGKSQMAPPTTWTSLEAAAVLLPWAPALLSGGQGLNAIREPTLHRVSKPK